MSNQNNLVGELGESMTKTALIAEIVKKSNHQSYPDFLFKPYFLGEKADLFDFIVFLLDADAKPTGAYFYVQVKSTKNALKSKSCEAKYSKKEVTRALGFKCPSYVVGVKTNGSNDDVYIRGISSSLKSGIYTAPLKNKLFLDEIKVKLYDEVANFFKGKKHNFTSAL